MKKILFTLLVSFLSLSCNASQDTKQKIEKQKEQIVAKSKKKRQKYLEIIEPWARKSLSKKSNSAIYMKIRNNTKNDIIITKANSKVAKTVEVHQTFTDEKGISRMKEVEQIIIPANETIEMKPGGMHIMLINLKRKLEPSNKFKCSLSIKRMVKGEYKKARNIRFEAIVGN